MKIHCVMVEKGGLFQCSGSALKTRAGRNGRVRLKRGVVLEGNNRRRADERWTGNRAFASQLKYKGGVGWARTKGPSEWLRESSPM